MPIDLSGLLDPAVSLPERPDGYVILALLAVAVLAGLFVSRRTFLGLRGRRWALFLLLLLLGVVLNAVFVAPLGSSPDASPPTRVVLLGLLCPFLAAAWVGVGPAMLVGLAGGVARWLLAGGRISHPVELALLTGLAAWLMRQNYRGWLADAMRRPLAAGFIASVFGWILAMPAIFATTAGSVLAALDYSMIALLPVGLQILLEGVTNSLLANLATLAFPALRPAPSGTETPFYALSLNRRLLFSILPITFLTISLQVFVVGATALEEANRKSLNRLSNTALGAANLVQSFFSQGQGLLFQYAADDRLRDPSAEVRNARLQSAIVTVRFFDQLLLLDADGRVRNWTQIGAAPTDSELPPSLTQDEEKEFRRVLDSEAPQRTYVHRDADGLLMMSFLEPVRSAEGAQTVLMGRTRLSLNPVMDAVKTNLFEQDGSGDGYLIDDNGRIVAHRNSERELGQWVFDTTQPAYASQPGGGRAYIGAFADKSRRFIFVQPVSGTAWTVVIELPYTAILRTAAQISAPLVLMFGAIMIGALVLIPFISRRITRPMGVLVQETGRIAGGDLGRPITDLGADEVGQLGAAFEGMRQSLKARMDDLGLLLNVSTDVAASLDLDRGIPPILDGAMQVSTRHVRTAPARLARLIVFDDHGQPGRVIARGEGPAAITPLDYELSQVTPRDERPLLIESVARSHGALDPALVGPGVRSIAAFPLRRQSQVLGVLWLGYADTRAFAESETSLLATLAGEAAVFLENVNLFESAEGGRRRLQAVLTSTNDAVIVTDHDSHILLCNPAAEIAFAIAPGGAVGRQVGEVIRDEIVCGLLAEADDATTRTAEVPLPDGRTLYASASTIVANDGQRIGRVAVLRDITHLKELDALKSEFVATVSHDLRAPLTYIRGYVTMIPMVGSIQPKQQDYLDKITGGVEQMTALIDDLLDLGRIEAGVGIVRESISLAHVAQEAVEMMQPNAANRRMTLKVERLEDCTVLGDRQLLKHAITNLIDNALKYTFRDGLVRVGVELRDGSAVVYVADNGIGIAPADQARLFEKFYRVKRRDTLDIKGTGLGLAIVKSVAEWHRGKVWVESQLGQGSIFYLSVPAGG